MNSVNTKKPWGSFTRFTNNEVSAVKILNINKGEELSLQYHNKREEFWKILKGSPEVIIGDDVIHPALGEELFIPVGVKHRISALKDDVEILEIAEGDFDEDDIVRVEDKYNRQ